MTEAANKKQAAAASRMVQVPGGRLHVTDHPGQEPALVALHGFPDDSRVYDRLAPLLAPRRVVALDWLGYGRSERVEPQWDQPELVAQLLKQAVPR